MIDAENELHAHNEYMYLFLSTFFLVFCFSYLFITCIVNGMIISVKKSISYSESNCSRAIVDGLKQTSAITVPFLWKPYNNLPASDFFSKCL